MPDTVITLQNLKQKDSNDGYQYVVIDKSISFLYNVISLKQIYPLLFAYVKLNNFLNN